jgi:hypothetical protein
VCTAGEYFLDMIKWVKYDFWAALSVLHAQMHPTYITLDFYGEEVDRKTEQIDEGWKSKKVKKKKKECSRLTEDQEGEEFRNIDGKPDLQTETQIHNTWRIIDMNRERNRFTDDWRERKRLIDEFTNTFVQR